MVTVACLQCWNGDILAMTFLKMLVITMMRTTWTMKDNFLFKWMRLVFTATRSLVLFHKLTEILTIQCLFILLHKKLTWNEARQNIPWQKRQKRNQDRKAKQNANKRKSCQEEQEEQGHWSGYSSSAPSSSWRPRYRWVQTSNNRR